MERHLDRLLRGSAELPLGISQLGLATPEQLTRLFYSPTSLTHVKELLKQLEDLGYIKHAGKPYYYLLAEKGVRYLRSLGIEASTPDPVKSKLFLEHTLELNDLIISAAQVGAPFYLHHFIHERVMKKNPFKASGAFVVPDISLDFGVKETAAKLAVLVEHDRATEEQVFFRRKIRSYMTLLRSGEKPEWLATTNFTIVFTVFNNPQRRDELREWTLAELAYDTDLSSAFLFASLPKQPTPDVWLEKIWYTAYESEAMELLEM